MITDKQAFITILERVEREGIENLISFLESSDFFTAPASTKYHGAYSGGLLIHSLNVYDTLLDIRGVFPENNISYESLIICGLLHDVCKINFYRTVEKWRRDDKNKWESYTAYEIADDEPYGHGEKSVMILERFIKLSDLEKYSIRWHMGGFDTSVKGGDYSFNRACEKFPFITVLHSADLISTHCKDGKK